MIKIGEDAFELQRDVIDVTSNHRPNTAWYFTDRAGHVHRWYDVNGEPASGYDPRNSYKLPTLKWVKDGEEYWEDDDEPHDIGHLECVQCGEHIKPGYTADDIQQFIPGLLCCYINGQPVSREEFIRRYEATGHILPESFKNH